MKEYLRIKNFRIVRILFLVIFFLSNGIAFAYNFKENGICYNIIDNNSVEVTHGVDYTGAITIPSVVKNKGKEYTVAAIGNEAFYGCWSLTKITIPSTVTSIGYKAFWYCKSLTSIIIPSSVTSIGIAAFLSCTSLTSIAIPSSVTSIEDSAFWNCKNLTNITIPSSVTTIGQQAFEDCESLTGITFPAKLTSIGKCAFLRCESLTKVICLANTPPIMDYSFEDIDSNAILYVPATAIPAYKSSNWTKYFSKILPIR